MQNIKQQLSQMKDATEEQLESFFYDNAVQAVEARLEESGIDIADVEPEELETLVAEEIQSQKEFAKGLATGVAGFGLLFGILG